MKPFKELVFSILDAFRARDQKKLRKINDIIMEDAALNFTRPVYELAVLAYILSKITSKPRFLAKENSPHLRRIEDEMRELAQISGAGDEEKTIAAFRRMDASIALLEKVDPRFVRDLVSKGRLKTAATMYAQGISLGLAADMTNIPKQDILGYAGRTMMFDRVKGELSPKDRLKAARRAMGGHE